MKKLIVVLAVASSLIGAGSAYAGCWATVGISPLPTDVTKGETWVVDVKVLQHGRTPMPDATPTVMITNRAGEQRMFAAEPANRATGVYRAEVVFPSDGTWNVAVNDGFPYAECAQTHTFGSYEIGAPAGPSGPGAQPPAPAPSVTASSEGSFPVWPLVGGLAGALLLAALALGVRRQLRTARPGRVTGP